MLKVIIVILLLILIGASILCIRIGKKWYKDFMSRFDDLYEEMQWLLVEHQATDEALAERMNQGYAEMRKKAFRRIIMANHFLRKKKRKAYLEKKYE